MVNSRQYIIVGVGQLILLIVGNFIILIEGHILWTRPYNEMQRQFNFGRNAEREVDQHQILDKTHIWPKKILLGHYDTGQNPVCYGSIIEEPFIGIIKRKNMNFQASHKTAMILSERGYAVKERGVIKVRAFIVFHPLLVILPPTPGERQGFDENLFRSRSQDFSRPIWKRRQWGRWGRW